ncbi:amyloid protein-binding protein 2 [Uranotaenia lowii]|uniref:amyloid protein-binding protein 2 n=1 Tax=Uranotaenia lowii TaxID=190385 RepID=UPI0024787FB4|nr:amyloid protein-binding protein 2 [Uranotaenia lowii]
MPKEPPSLYQQCLQGYVKNLNLNVTSLDRIADLRLLPTSVLANIYEQMCNFESLKDVLLVQLCELDVFQRLIKQTALKQTMFKCVQTLMTARRPIVTELRTIFCRTTTVYFLQHPDIALVKQCSLERLIRASGTVCSLPELEAVAETSSTSASHKNIQFVVRFLEQIDNGIRLGSFLSESGWIEESLHVFNITLAMIEELRFGYQRYLIELNCLQKLLSAQTVFCCFKEANISCVQALNIIDMLTHQQQQKRRSKQQQQQTSNFSCVCFKQQQQQLQPPSYAAGDLDSLSSIPNSLLANIYQQISVLHFYRSEYDLSYKWAIRALKHINKHTPDKVVVDVLRQVAKSCVAKRQFQSASMLIKQAVCRARASFGTSHQKYADALLDYGFFLLNVDSIANSVAMYTEAHEILCGIFGSRNLHVAVAHEDLAYCLYVLEYSSGKFDSATANIDRAIDIMKELVPSNHLMLASAKRVKALILEEIALDTMAAVTDYNRCKSLLEESELLHHSALNLSLEAFGEINVQTAKHYGNLGRLYQSMGKFDEAEQMHKRAIEIKTLLLGPYDYEVGLSIGHLASLYNYHMQKHQEAEELYIKSIEISLRLFGESYSGLEYDYRGLIHFYEITGDRAQYDHYNNVLEDWRVLREENQAVRNNFPAELTEDTSMEEVTRKFFEMCSSNGVGCVNDAFEGASVVDELAEGGADVSSEAAGKDGSIEDQAPSPCCSNGSCGNSSSSSDSSCSSNDEFVSVENSDNCLDHPYLSVSETVAEEAPSLNPSGSPIVIDEQLVRNT